MKWVIFISCLFLVSSADSRYPPRRVRDAGHVEDTLNSCKELPLTEFAGLALLLFSQYAQTATLDEVNKLVEDLTELKKKCDADGHSDPKCEMLLHTLFLDELCHEEGFAAKYGFTDCCAKADPERNECIISHKNETPGFIPPYQRPEPEEVCKAFEDDGDQVLARYFYEIARRSPFTNVNTLSESVDQYDEMLRTCCKEADKAACFGEKARAIKKQTKEAILQQQVICSLREKFGHKLIETGKLAQLSQMFPRADFATLSKIAHDITHMHEQRCHGDTMQSLLDSGRLSDYICVHKETLSTKLDDCCGRSELDRLECLPHVENDDKPADLSPSTKGFLTKEACQHYAENQTVQVEKFIYENGRRHPEYSPQLLLRYGIGYKDFMDQACTKEHPEESLSLMEEALQNHTAKTWEIIKGGCNIRDQRKDFSHNDLLVQFTKKAPQLSFDDLYKYTKKFDEIGDKCCYLNDSKSLVCIEGQVFGVLGAFCLQHEQHPINAQVGRCCDMPYALWMMCVHDLEVDPKYTPVPFAPEFHHDLCSANEEDQKKKTQMLLVNLVKHKPDISEEQRQTIGTDFTAMQQKCCHAENHEECFQAEGPKLVERAKATLGEH
ncbi:albumin-like [Hemicordylus capensis]|uniref:albumin-like n=1 Tax=Hemicordylus capensis TaxID=884348 RepID=UPI0023034575|nr:albumin-like [Hemicordylus capensis]